MSARSSRDRHIPLTVVVTPLAGAAGSFTTTFTVAGENIRFEPARTTPHRLPSRYVPSADLAVAITPGTSGPNDQQSWTYTMTVSNLGPSDASDVVLTAPVAG